MLEKSEQFLFFYSLLKYIIYQNIQYSKSNNKYKPIFVKIFLMVNTNQHIIGLFRASRWRLGSVLADPFGMGLLSDLVDKSVRKAVLKVRKSVFEKMMEEESYQLRNDNIIIMKGAKPSETELQTVDKLAKTNEYYVVFPNDGQIKEVRSLTNDSGEKRNDVFLIDKITYKAIAADIKTCGNPSVETIIAHLSGGVNQAPNLILDITGKMSKAKLIIGLRRGWSKRLKSLYLNYHGQWYRLDRDLVYDKKWLTDHVK